MARGELAGAHEVARRIHRHAGGPLHQRLDDQRRRARMVLREERLERGDRGVDGGIRVAAVAGAGGGRGQHRVRAQQRGVGVAEQRDVGHRERADRLPVVAAGESRVMRLARGALPLPVVEAHLQRDLGRRRAVGGIERVRQSRGRERRQSLGQLDDRAVGEAGEHHVLELGELRGQRRVDPRVGVAEQVDPPRSDRIEVAAPVVVVEPGPGRARDRDRRRLLVLLHLRAGVPDRIAAAQRPVAARCHHACPKRARIRRTAATSSRAIPGSRTECPASGTTTHSASGHACASASALTGGQTTS